MISCGVCGYEFRDLGPGAKNHPQHTTAELAATIQAVDLAGRSLGALVLLRMASSVASRDTGRHAEPAWVDQPLPGLSVSGRGSEGP